MKRLWIILGVLLVVGVVFAGIIMKSHIEASRYPVGKEALEQYFKITRADLDRSWYSAPAVATKIDYPHGACYLDPEVYAKLTLDEKHETALRYYMDYCFVLGKAQPVLFFYDGCTGKRLAEYSFKSGFRMEN